MPLLLLTVLPPERRHNRPCLARTSHPVGPTAGTEAAADASNRSKPRTSRLEPGMRRSILVAIAFAAVAGLGAGCTTGDMAHQITRFGCR